VQLESEVKQLNERIAQLEYDLANGGVPNTNPFHHSMYSADDAMLISSSSLLMASPEHMGFFDP
jgi:hypothetical protein